MGRQPARRCVNPPRAAARRTDFRARRPRCLGWGVTTIPRARRPAPRRRPGRRYRRQGRGARAGHSPAPGVLRVPVRRAGGCWSPGGRWASAPSPGCGPTRCAVTRLRARRCPTPCAAAPRGSSVCAGDHPAAGPPAVRVPGGDGRGGRARAVPGVCRPARSGGPPSAGRGRGGGRRMGAAGPTSAPTCWRGTAWCRRWCREQVPQLVALGPDPGRWPEAHDRLLPAAARI